MTTRSSASHQGGLRLQAQGQAHSIHRIHFIQVLIPNWFAPLRSPSSASRVMHSSSSSPKEGMSCTSERAGRENVRELRSQTSAPELSLSVPSSHRDGTSTCDPSPVSPATPQSIDAPPSGHGRTGMVPSFYPLDKGRTIAHSPYSYPVIRHVSHEWSTDYPRTPQSLLRGTDSRLSACRHSCSDGEESDNDVVMRPVRPW